MIEVEHDVRPRFGPDVTVYLDSGQEFKVLGNLGETALQFGEMPGGAPVLWHPPERDTRIVGVGELIFFNGPDQLNRLPGNEPGTPVLYGQAHFPEAGGIIPTNYSQHGGVSAYDVAKRWPLNRPVGALMFDRRFSDVQEHFERMNVGLFSIGWRVIGVMNRIPTALGDVRPVDRAICRQDEVTYKPPSGIRKLAEEARRRLDPRVLSLDERDRFVEMLPDHITGRDRSIILSEHGRSATRSSIEAIRLRAPQN